jgi:Zn finger protein HypA/HybF involved in hydrogenase expression
MRPRAIVSRPAQPLCQACGSPCESSRMEPTCGTCAIEARVLLRALGVR